MSFIFLLTGVQLPQLAASTLAERAGDYGALAAAAAAASAEVQEAVSSVAADNQGSTTDAFLANTQGSGSAAEHLTQLSEAAARTQEVFVVAATRLATCKVAMKSIAKAAEQPFLRELLNPNLAQGRIRQIQIVAAARRRLVAVESSTTSVIDAAFAGLMLPSPFAVEYYTAVPPEIADAWDDLSVEQKRRLMQLLADQQADRLGIPRTTIEFYNDPSDTSMGVRTGDGKLRINEAYYDSPDMIGVPVHEMQHMAQYVYMDEYDDIARDPEYLDDVLAGRVPDPLQEQYGVSTEDVQRLKEGNASHVRDKGYWERPVEIDARRSGDRFTDGLTIQEFEELVK
ncbi:hypothetical protein SAMN02745244_03682 [Tessaracoccus bendigoensis DSM 12906]|uniref:Uncharacterized protein n=1 Tax=Tessaracoccus bendigoensis DSM 12906 TaxID=1123357 RepID=A0A1M6NP20_9ACTN|nr:hypothetical protein [Tessaracoccus bendigoensis]SHJ97366.1 hypothetical protein SAMN02745244_03682 [Tessaracoccus bendigoensis DSM 12906]